MPTSRVWCPTLPGRGKESRGKTTAGCRLPASRRLELLDDFGDFELGLADLAAADLEQDGGPLELGGEPVDVERIVLDPREHGLELADRFGECRFGRLFAHPVPPVPSTRLTSRPRA